MLYPEYESLVVQDYEKKKAGNVLHSGLTDPTPAGIRDACSAIFHERYRKSDEKTLKEFFMPKGETSEWSLIIEGHPLGKFKALAKFLNKETESTKKANMELLAWLIDFQPRPFVIGNTIKINQPENGETEIVVRDAKGKEIQGTQTPQNVDQEKGPNGRGRQWLTGKKIGIGLAFVVIIILAAVGIDKYWLKTSKPIKYALTGHESCMFWDEDRYQPISCTQHGDTIIVPLDSTKFLHFRKVMKPDTITTNAIGILWYTRYRKDYEFYTSDGYHPIDPTLRLRPITEFIIRNHIRRQR